MQDDNNKKIISSSARWQVPGDVPRSRPMLRNKSVESVEPIRYFSSQSPISRLSDKAPAKEVAITNIAAEQANANKPLNNSKYLPTMIGLLLIVGLFLLQSSTGLFDKTISHAVANISTPILTEPQKADAIPLTHIKEEKHEAKIPTPHITDKKITLKLTQSPDNATRIITHTVIKGDTLWHIASKYVKDPFRYPELAQLSQIVNPDLIYPGNKVYIQI